MADAKSAATRDLERVLGRVLQIGTLLSTIVLAAGLMLALAWPAHQSGDGLMRAGLVILMATPATRVLVSVFKYVGQRDWLFAGLTATVLLVIASSLLLALI